MSFDLVTSRDNPALQRLRKLAADPAGYRKTGTVWMEGDHLLRAARTRGWTPALVVATEAAMARPELAELALDCGFSSASHLVRSFRAHLGVTPTQFSIFQRNA